MTLKCYTCQEQKNPELFYKNRSIKSGYSRRCIACTKENLHKYAKNRAASNRNAHAKAHERNSLYIYEILVNSVCVDCEIADPRVLEFDHRDQTLKVANVSHLLYYSLDKLKNEIEKCDIRCANCHRIRTQNQLGWFRSKWGIEDELGG